MYDITTSLRMTSSFGDDLTAGVEGGFKTTDTKTNHKNHLLLEEVVPIHAIRGLFQPYLLLYKQTLYFTDVS